MEGHESPLSIGQKGTCTTCENNRVYGVWAEMVG